MRLSLTPPLALRFAFGAAVLLLAVPAAVAQHGDHGGHAGHEAHASRAESHPVGRPAALSADDVTALREGQGMGLARAAELNRYPGPLHVIELADRLALTPAQREETEAIRAAMLDEARALGEQILMQEEALDAVFAQERATPALVDAVTAEIGALQGRLRAAHLRAHVAQRAVLTPVQVAAYDRLRGYTPD